MKIRQIVLWATLLLIFGQSILMISEKEEILNSGKVIYLELAPVDPRSLIQGDYMNLRYAISNDWRRDSAGNRSTIKAVIALDSQDVAHFVRFHREEKVLVDGEYLLELFSNGFRLQVGPTAFFFQEGDAHYYEDAEYAELRLSPEGETILVGMRGESLEKLGPPKN